MALNPNVTMTAADLPDGPRAAQWNGWEVILEGRDGRWSASVAMLSADPQTQHPVTPLKQADFASATAAAKWAETQLKDHGQIVFLLSSDGRPPRTLVDMLLFEPVVS